jgi:hypothetical protein
MLLHRCPEVRYAAPHDCFTSRSCRQTLAIEQPPAPFQYHSARLPRPESAGDDLLEKYGQPLN